MISRNITRYLEVLVMASITLVTALCLSYAKERVSALMLDEPFDHAIFARAGHEFWQTGQFYPRVNEPYPTFLPGAATFKFPPVYQLYIAPWVKQGITTQYYQNSYFVCLVFYISSVILLCRHILSILQPASRCFTVCFTGISVSAVCLFEPFYSGFMLLVGEIPLFFCCVAALFFASRKPALAGTVIAAAATAKIYPAFLLLYAFALRSKKQRMYFIGGFFAGCSVLLLLTIYFFGAQELTYYLATVFPVLMKEHPMGISENHSLIFFLFPNGITHHFAESVFIFIRLTTMALFGCITAYYFRNYKRSALKDTLLYSLLITSMIIFLANYWIQYELLLLIPCLVILGITFHNHQSLLAVFSVITLLTLMSSTELADTLFIAYADQPLATIADKIEQNGILRTQLEISPSAFLIAHLAPLKPLAPYSLFLIISLLLIQEPTRS